MRGRRGCDARGRRTYFLVGGEGFDQALGPVDFLEDHETLPSFAGVFGHFDVITTEEEPAEKRGEVTAVKLTIWATLRTRVPRGEV